MILRNLVAIGVVFFTISTMLQPSQATRPLPPLPILSVFWLDQVHARIVWIKPGCLYRIPENTNTGYFLGCSKSPGKMILPGDGPNDFSLFPKGGDTYRLLTDDNQTFDAVLPHRYKTFGPLVIHLWSFEHHQVWLPVVIAQT